MGNWPSNYTAPVAKSGFGGKVISNNWSEGGFGVTDAVMISGHRTVKTKEDLFAIPSQILSTNISNGGTDYSDAIGQIWWVQDLGLEFKLVSWNDRKNDNGWQLTNQIGTTGNLIPGIGTGYLWENVVENKNQQDYLYSENYENLNHWNAIDSPYIYIPIYSKSDEESGKAKWAYSPILPDNGSIFTIAFQHPYIYDKNGKLQKIQIEVYFTDLPYLSPDRKRYKYKYAPTYVNGVEYNGPEKEYVLTSMDDLFNSFSWIYKVNDKNEKYHLEEKTISLNKVAEVTFTSTNGGDLVMTGNAKTMNIMGIDTVFIDFTEYASTDKSFFFRIKTTLDSENYSSYENDGGEWSLNKLRCYLGNLNGSTACFFRQPYDYTSATLEKCMQYRYDELDNKIKGLSGSSGESNTELSKKIDELQNEINALRNQLNNLNSTVIKKSSESGNTASYLWTGNLTDFNKATKNDDTTFIIND